MSDLISLAINAKQGGDITLAKQLLSQALIQEPNNETAWMLMSEVVGDVRLRRNCLERVLSINPNNEEASIALTRLNTTPLSPVTRGERDKPFDATKFKKIPPFTPPFTWNGDQEQFLALGELTYPEIPAEQPDQTLETEPTFDWANESEEPDKTIQKIFDAISNPEQASQPLPDTDLSVLNETTPEGQVEPTFISEEVKEAMWLNVLVGEDEVPPQEAQPAAVSDEDFGVNAEQQLGLDAFTTPDQPIESLSADHLLWDNPKIKTDRLVILSNKSIIHASPKESDIPHILGLFAENKMLRDLLGEDAGVIKLESIQRLTANPKDAKLVIDYLNKDGKEATHLLVFSEPRVRDEALTALSLRLGTRFTEVTEQTSMADKIIPPVVVLSFIAFLIWGILTGLPMLSGLPDSQLGVLQSIISALESFVSFVGQSRLLLVLGIAGVLAVIWLVLDLRKPSTVVYLQRH